MQNYKTPGVYIVEKTTPPNAVVEVATAVPAFIGYTEKAIDGNTSLLNKPFRISSMAEFRIFFGGASVPQFDLSKAQSNKDSTSTCVPVKQTTVPFTLYYQMLMFYNNAGGPCYIVSVGDYTSKEISATALKTGIDSLATEQEPTLLLCPEAVQMENKELCSSVQHAMLSLCAGKMRNRFAILDVFDGYKNRKDLSGDVISDFRNNIGDSLLSFAAAYYPWLHTSVTQERDLSLLNFKAQSLKTLLTEELTQYPSPQQILIQQQVDKLGTVLNASEQDELHATLYQNSPIYRTVLKEAQNTLNLLAPSAAMAGVYTRVDNTRGVWKAPANITLQCVTSVAVDLTSDDQNDLNTPLSSKTVNVIRAFPGDGVKVWGARTLDGTSLDCKFINVRRTMMMLEDSIKEALRAYAFEPNDAATWTLAKSMICNFLHDIWKRGGLAGTTPGDAFSVHIGLGDTMTPDDILNGVLRVRLLVALFHPAEFTKITFQQQIQKQ